MKKRLGYFTLLCLTIIGSLSTGNVQAQSVSFVGVTLNATDYSNAGLDIGNAGFWFPQFAATAPITNALVDDNDVNQFPAWVLPNFDKTNAGYSFQIGAVAGDAYSAGGDTSWDNLTLPDGVSGLSGAVVDPASANNSSNTIRSLLLGAGTPTDFTLHVVTDNTDGDHDPLSRIRVRLERGGGDVGDLNHNPVDANFNQSADVYSFRVLGALPGDLLKLQLNSAVAAERASFGGLMFDVPIPEPSSAALLTLGGIAVGALRRRRS